MLAATLQQSCGNHLEAMLRAGGQSCSKLAARLESRTLAALLQQSCSRLAARLAASFAALLQQCCSNILESCSKPCSRPCSKSCSKPCSKHSCNSPAAKQTLKLGRMGWGPRIGLHPEARKYVCTSTLRLAVHLHGGLLAFTW